MKKKKKQNTTGRECFKVSETTNEQEGKEPSLGHWDRHQRLLPTFHFPPSSFVTEYLNFS